MKLDDGGHWVVKIKLKSLKSTGLICISASYFNCIECFHGNRLMLWVSPSGFPRSQWWWLDPENVQDSCWHQRTEPGTKTTRKWSQMKNFFPSYTWSLISEKQKHKHTIHFFPFPVNNTLSSGHFSHWIHFLNSNYYFSLDSFFLKLLCCRFLTEYLSFYSLQCHLGWDGGVP